MDRSDWTGRLPALTGELARLDPGTAGQVHRLHAGTDSRWHVTAGCDRVDPATHSRDLSLADALRTGLDLKCCGCNVSSSSLRDAWGLVNGVARLDRVRELLHHGAPGLEERGELLREASALRFEDEDGTLPAALSPAARQPVQDALDVAGGAVPVPETVAGRWEAVRRVGLPHFAGRDETFLAGGGDPQRQHLAALVIGTRAGAPQEVPGPVVYLWLHEGWQYPPMGTLEQELYDLLLGEIAPQIAGRRSGIVTVRSTTALGVEEVTRGAVLVGTAAASDTAGVRETFETLLRDDPIDVHNPQVTRRHLETARLVGAR